MAVGTEEPERPAAIGACASERERARRRGRSQDNERHELSRVDGADAFDALDVAASSDDHRSAIATNAIIPFWGRRMGKGD